MSFFAGLLRQNFLRLVIVHGALVVKNAMAIIQLDMIALIVTLSMCVHILYKNGKNIHATVTKN